MVVQASVLGWEADGTLANSSSVISNEAMNYLLVFYGALSLMSGVPILLNAKKRRVVAETSVAKRLAEIAGGAEESYFEERRSLEAYPPPSSDTKMRWLGALLTVLGIASIMMGIID